MTIHICNINIIFFFRQLNKQTIVVCGYRNKFVAIIHIDHLLYVFENVIKKYVKIALPQQFLNI